VHKFDFRLVINEKGSYAVIRINACLDIIYVFPRPSSRLLKECKQTAQVICIPLSKGHYIRATELSLRVNVVFYQLASSQESAIGPYTDCGRYLPYYINS